MKIASPPKLPIEDSLKLAVEKIQQQVMPRISDEKNRYSHWDKVRHLEVPKNFETIEQYWHFIKFSRMQQQKNLPFIEGFSFILTDNIQENIHKIDSKMRGSIEAKNIDDNKDRYIIRSLIDEAISSSQLEGAATTRKVARDMLRNNKKPEDHSQRMIYNNYQAIKFINHHKNDNLTPSLILELQAIVTDKMMDDSEVGKLRQDNEINVVDNSSGDILHHPPEFQSLPDRLKILCDFANGNSPDYFVHPIIRAIVVHFMLAFDHPFTDGNGRTARALFYWVVLKNNYWLFQYVTLSTYIKKAQAQYGESFLMVESDGFDLTYFINSQLKFINQSIKDLFDYVNKKQNQQQQVLHLLSAYLADGKLNSRQTMIIQHAIKHPGSVYTIAGHKLSHHIGYATAKSDLEKLKKLDLLLQSKRGRAFVFIAPDDLEQQIKAY